VDGEPILSCFAIIGIDLYSSLFIFMSLLFGTYDAGLPERNASTSAFKFWIS
jgi:hypothetical protein